ncbi:unnamed protein product [Rotaria socialis]|uniref:Uncharacterized protein n=1 Tax=Rotaria socialis TaxID=392032 RepID=A0A817NY91_9BILA|nr:unnamed protein product [Rotaria socialis]
MPTNGSTVIIPHNVTVSISSQTGLTINIISMRVYGTLQIGSSINSSLTTFTFQYPVNIMIFKGGVLRDLTQNHRWFVLSNTIITIYNGGSFISSQPTTLISNTNNSTATFNSSISGPYTITVDLQGKIQKYSSITFAPSESGDFGLNSTWLGGLAPTVDRCSPDDGGCNLIIPTNFNITRENNQSTINGVNVYIYGLFEISSWASYLFLYPMHFFVYNGGVFQDSTINGFYFRINTSINIYAGGLFVTHSPSYIISYIEKNTTISQIVLNDSKIYGPYTIVIDNNGIIDNNGSSSLSTSITTTSRCNAGTLLTSSSYLAVLTVPFYIIMIIHRK